MWTKLSPLSFVIFCIITFVLVHNVEIIPNSIKYRTYQILKYSVFRYGSTICRSVDFVFGLVSSLKHKPDRTPAILRQDMR